MKPAAIAPLAAVLLLAACGEAPSTTGADGPTTTTPAGCAYYDIAGCALYGLVLAQPLPTADALAAVAGLPGVAVAVWRADLVCVLDTTMQPPGEPATRSPSRFAYVDAGGLRERRLATSGVVAPPITGLHISESYWNRWEDQWARAQENGVLVEALALYLPSATVAAGPPDGFRAVLPLPWRRTDTLDPAAYPGELLVESEGFPNGYLSEPAPLTCE